MESKEAKDVMKNKPSQTGMPKKFESIDHTQITGEVRQKQKEPEILQNNFMDTSKDQMNNSRMS